MHSFTKKFAQEAATRFVENLKQEKNEIEKNIAIAVQDQAAINTGYLYLLQEKQNKNKKLLNEAKKQIKFIEVEIEEDVVEEIEGIEFSEVEEGIIEVVEVDDDDIEVIENEVSDEEDDEEENEDVYEDELELEIVTNIE